MECQHAAHRLDNQLDVGPKAALQDVEQVEVDPLVEGDGVAVAPRLPVAGDARLHQKALALAWCVLGDLGGQGGPGTHHREVALQDVDELGHLVERGATQQATDARHARVVAHLEDGSGLLVERLQLGEALLGVREHAAELVHGELAPVLGDPPLHEEDRALRVVELDGDRDDGEEPAEAGQDHQAEDDVEGALDEAVGVAPREPLGRGDDLGVAPL